MNIEKLKSDLDKMLSVSESTREDELAARYEICRAVINHVTRKSDEAKEAILAEPRARKMFSQISQIVLRTGMSSLVTLFKGRAYNVQGRVNPGNKSVDMEALRLALRIPEKRWKAEVEKATTRRDPTVTIQIASK